MKQKILISGSSGLVGSALLEHFSASDYDVWRLVRRDPGLKEIFWDPANQVLENSAIENFDIVIHLSGENISGKRWSKRFKEQIVKSRIESTSLLSTAISKTQNKPKLFACASATGYYGNRGDAELSESANAGEMFLSYVVSNWENAAQPVVSAGIRTIFMRFGVILSPDEGALKKVLPIFKSGLGGKIGPGNQYMPWISILEIPHIVEFMIENKNLSGPVNIVSPYPVTNAHYTKILAEVLHRPAVFSVPAFILKSTLGEMAEELLLASTRVIPQKLTDNNYKFRYPELKRALSDLLDMNAS
jgi:uncharacterized protein